MEKTQNAIVETDEENVNDEISKLVKFNKPYKFEDETYNSIDLSGLDDLTTTDLIAAERKYDKSGTYDILPEMTLSYAMCIASRATNLPIEFFYGLPPKEGLKIKARIRHFFFVQD